MQLPTPGPARGTYAAARHQRVDFALRLWLRLWPWLAVTVLDSNGKKARFLRHAARALKLGNVQVVEARVEDHRPAAPYAAITSRAFATLKDFFSLTRHLLA